MSRLSRWKMEWELQYMGRQWQKRASVRIFPACPCLVGSDSISLESLCKNEKKRVLICMSGKHGQYSPYN